MSWSIRQSARPIAVALAYALLYLLLWAGLVLLIAGLGIRHYWGDISVSQMMLNLVSVETEGGGGSIVWIGIFGIGVAPILISAAIGFLHYRWRHPRDLPGRHMRRAASAARTRALAVALVGVVVVSGTTAFANTVGVADYIAAANSDADLGDYYVEPVVTSDENARNLVVVYLESGEATLEDERLFEKDAFAPIKEVTQPSEGWVNTGSLRQYRGGGWTMSGIVASECGVPLKATGAAASEPLTNDLGTDTPTYLGGLTCSGDVLKDHGYTSVFLTGANAAFAGKGTYLRTHGYTDVKDLNDWRASDEPPEAFREDWGLSDGSLMNQAKLEVDRLHAESERTGQRFNLSMLTLDTHEPSHIYDYCQVDTEIDVLSVNSCSVAQVAGLVNHMRDQGYLEDTAVVIVGDHLRRSPPTDPLHEQLDGNPTRSIFNRIWIPGGSGPVPLRQNADQFSLYPTLLEAAGLTLQDGAAGLGVSVFTPEIPANSSQALAPKAYDILLDSLSLPFYARAWAAEGTS
ncbi:MULTISPECIES: LTA synthase family protein [unclassified Arthrobacter]|uniref:LTA synthase family protein n=1 Tax=unclassified Arthrobacter TaxID=235627 RepID=UPI0006F33105|nr:LTA synthase family protein [Arthrobacter sp. Leaf234]KQO01646.1 sulfatase [Arthrobacter sp. Leaf234]